MSVVTSYIKVKTDESLLLEWVDFFSFQMYDWS
jgi:hypothetical protein